jgi:hypothetical protein
MLLYFHEEPENQEKFAMERAVGPSATIELPIYIWKQILELLTLNDLAVFASTNKIWHTNVREAFISQLADQLVEQLRCLTSSSLLLLTNQVQRDKWRCARRFVTLARHLKDVTHQHRKRLRPSRQLLATTQMRPKTRFGDRQLMKLVNYLKRLTEQQISSKLQKLSLSRILELHQRLPFIQNYESILSAAKIIQG